jgi:hypothetical protein
MLDHNWKRDNNVAEAAAEPGWRDVPWSELLLPAPARPAEPGGVEAADRRDVQESHDEALDEFLTRARNTSRLGL